MQHGSAQHGAVGALNPARHCALHARRVTNGWRLTSARRAMTLIEVIVVVVILGVLAGVIVPRMMQGQGRFVQAKASEAAEVLTALARRDAALSQTIALEFSSEESVLRVRVLDVQKDRAQWRDDRLLPTADLHGVNVEALEVDGAEVSPSVFRIVLTQTTPRPGLRMVLTSDKHEFPQSVELAGTAGQASVVDGDSRGRGLAGGVAVDLDAQGRDREAW